MVKSAEYYKKMMAKMNEDGFHGSEEEKLLWEKRERMEKRIEKKEKMLYNAQQRLNCRWILDDFEKVESEVREMEEEVRDIREEMSGVDRKIRMAEREG
jgi:hypothetical protein